MEKSIIITVEEFARQLHLKVLVPGRGSIEFLTSEINRPGLQFTGYYEHFPKTRVQLLGRADMDYLCSLREAECRERIADFMSHNVPCIVCSRDRLPPACLLEAAERCGTPVLLSKLITGEISHRIYEYLTRALAPRIFMHGEMMDVFGVGVLILGESGMGKSETALELIRSGHRLVADDVVEITRVGDKLLGYAPEATRHLMEVRGIGIIDVRHLYGMGAIILEKAVDLVIDVELLDSRAEYERFGASENTIDILGVEVPHMVLPISPGRNLAVLTEIAARNFRLKRLGYMPDQSLMQIMGNGTDKL